MNETHEPPTSGVAPYLSVRNGAAAIEFYTRAFGAELLERYDFEGKLGHATLQINDGIVMLADEFPEHEAHIGNVAPATLDNRTTFTLNLYVTDADAWFDKAIAEGASVVRPCKDEFFGRHGKIRDPFGHVWSFVALKPHDPSAS
ncbi:bleomycin resistance protein [Maricaulis sp. W15]|uniref:VOC family protein n=1 Tax=Maricaulis sp. W15 TaxID=1772333 RepID=UPI000948D95C|nr:VOC family protein [Maricaulis sp. W15]OLF73212.1 bleomycin resistance protein [Maricaulis sp. W15]